MPRLEKEIVFTYEHNEMTNISKQDAALALASVPGVGATLYSRLVWRFGSPEAVWNAPAAALAAVRQLPKKVMEAISRGPDIQAVANIRNSMEEMGAWLLTIHDSDYPPDLLNIPQAPPVLFGLGDKSVLSARSVAIVGSRKASSYGMRVAEEFAAGLVRQGYCIVSGLALGIDSAAHRGAVSAGGPTVAVKGCGIDVPYPVRNLTLSEEIAANGAVISEFFPGVKPEARNFPARNRIISGLSSGVIVVEAGRKSGSLITAYIGLEQGREIMAVPGNIYSFNSIGCHHLIREGAILVSNVRHAVEVLGGVFSEKRVAAACKKVKISALLPEEQLVIDNMGAEPQHIDEIAVRCNMPAAVVSRLLLGLELKGAVMSCSGGRYCNKYISSEI